MHASLSVTFSQRQVGACFPPRLFSVFFLSSLVPVGRQDKPSLPAWRSCMQTMASEVFTAAWQLPMLVCVRQPSTLWCMRTSRNGWQSSIQKIRIWVSDCSRRKLLCIIHGFTNWPGNMSSIFSHRYSQSSLLVHSFPLRNGWENSTVEPHLSKPGLSERASCQDLLAMVLPSILVREQYLLLRSVMSLTMFLTVKFFVKGKGRMSWSMASKLWTCKSLDIPSSRVMSGRWPVVGSWCEWWMIDPPIL